MEENMQGFKLAILSDRISYRLNVYLWFGFNAIIDDPHKINMIPINSSFDIFMLNNK